MGRERDAGGMSREREGDGRRGREGEDGRERQGGSAGRRGPYDFFWLLERCADYADERPLWHRGGSLPSDFRSDPPPPPLQLLVPEAPALARARDMRTCGAEAQRAGCVTVCWRGGGRCRLPRRGSRSRARARPAKRSRLVRRRCLCSADAFALEV